MSFEDGGEAGEGVVVADKADFVEGETARFPGGDCDGPGCLGLGFSLACLH